MNVNQVSAPYEGSTVGCVVKLLGRWHYGEPPKISANPALEMLLWMDISSQNCFFSDEYAGCLADLHPHVVELKLDYRQLISRSNTRYVLGSQNSIEKWHGNDKHLTYFD